MGTLVGRVLGLQAAITGVAALLGMLIFGQQAAWAALAAGSATIFPALAYARVVARVTVATPPNAVLLMHAIAGMVKLILTLIILLTLFRFLQNEFSIPYFFGSFIACLMSYGVAPLFK